MGLGDSKPGLIALVRAKSLTLVLAVLLCILIILLFDFVYVAFLGLC
jgi:hypothetical protein